MYFDYLNRASKLVNSVAGIACAKISITVHVYQAKSKMVSHFIRSIRRKYETEIAPLAAPNPKNIHF